MLPFKMMKLEGKRVGNHRVMIFVWLGIIFSLIDMYSNIFEIYRKFSKQKPIEEKKPCVGRCYIMKRDKMKEDNHLNKMIEDWKKKRSCVGVCYLVKVKMMKDKKFRREAETWNQASNENESGEEETIDYEEEDAEEQVSTIISTTAKPIFSQLLWNSYIKKTQKITLEI